MNDGHLVENRGTVVGNGHLASAGLDHLVHTTGSQAGANRIRNRFGGNDVALPHRVRLKLR